VTRFAVAVYQMPILYGGPYCGYISDELDFVIVSTHLIPGYERAHRLKLDPTDRNTTRAS
jgi:hypothetical protein